MHHRRRGLGECGKTVARYIVGDAERFARDAFVEIALERFARRKGDRVNEAIEPIPVLAKFSKERFDLRIFGHVAGNDELGAEFSRELGYPIAHSLALIGEGEPGALTLTRFRDSVGDRAVREHAGDENAPAL